MPDDIPPFEEFVTRRPPGPVARWLLNNPKALEVATDLLGQGKPYKAVCRYLTEYYDYPFQAESLANNVARLRDHPRV